MKGNMRNKLYGVFILLSVISVSSCGVKRFADIEEAGIKKHEDNISSGEEGSSGTALELADWQKGILGFLEEHQVEYPYFRLNNIPAEYQEISYDLIYVNEDDIPEIAVDTGAEAGGCLILTYSGEGVELLQTRRRGVAFLEKENLLNNSGGAYDQYFDYLYCIEDGKWVQLAQGEYQGLYLMDDEPGYDEARSRPIAATYTWNGVETSREEYNQNLDAIYDSTREIVPRYAYNAEELYLILTTRFDE